MQCAQPLFCFLERFLLTSSTPYCSAFLALFGYNCSDSGIKGWWEEGKKVEQREGLGGGGGGGGGGGWVIWWKKGSVSPPPPPPPLSLSWPRVTFFYWLTMFRGKWLVYFYFINYCVETTLLNGFSFSLSLLHSPNIHPIRDFFRSKLPLVCYV